MIVSIAATTARRVASDGINSLRLRRLPHPQHRSVGVPRLLDPAVEEFLGEVVRVRLIGRSGRQRLGDLQGTGSREKSLPRRNKALALVPGVVPQHVFFGGMFRFPTPPRNL